MKEDQKQMEALFNSPEAALLLKEQEAFVSLARSGEMHELMRLLKSGSGSVEAAATAAIQGDGAKLKQLLEEVSRNPEGAGVVETLEKRIKGRSKGGLFSDTDGK